MPGAGAIFLGKMLETLLPMLLVFAIAYRGAKKKNALNNSKLRVFVLFGYAFLISGLAYAISYEAIATSFGLFPEPEMRGYFDIPAQFVLVLAALASLLVIRFIGQSKTKAAAGTDNPTLV
jgi:FtsH-binding integral membrane protein